MKYLISTLFLLNLPWLFAQSKAVEFDFFDPSTKLFVIGEAHFEDDGDLQIALIDYIQNNTKIDVFITELSVEVGNIFNEYVLYGNRESDVNTIYSLLDEKVAKKTKLILEYLRSYNVSNTHKIQVRGIDMFHFYKLKRQMIGLSAVFPELKKVDLPLMKKYIVNQTGKNFNKKKSAAIIKEFIKETRVYQEQYNEYLGERIDIYKEHLNQLEFYYLSGLDYSWRKSDSIREVFMAKNLINALDCNSVSLMICGALHAMYKNEDTWYYDYPFTSMVATANSVYPDEVFSIVTQYYKDKKHKWNWVFNLLNEPMKYYVEDTPLKYLVFGKQQINNHPIANERCDMVIIQNEEFKIARNGKVHKE